MAIKDQVTQLITAVANLQTTLGAEVGELRVAFEDLRRRLGEIEALDIAPELNAIADAIAGVAALSDLAIAPDTEIPTTPGTPVASAVTATSVAFDWAASTDNVGVVNYEVFQNGISIGMSGGPATFTAVTSPATNYLFAVVAKDAAGNTSALSAALDVTTPTA